MRSNSLKIFGQSIEFKTFSNHSVDEVPFETGEKLKNRSPKTKK